MTNNCLVYIVDDDKDLREAVMDTLEDAGFVARGFSVASEVLKELDPEWPGVIVSDIRMPGMTGLEFLSAATELAPDVPFVLITGYGDVKTAIRAMKDGAYDFLEKPTTPELLLGVIRRALEMRRLQIENSSLKQILSASGPLKSRLIGRSKPMRAVRKSILAIAPLDVDVLVTGETGTGKELVARCIHNLSPRAGENFEVVNCGALTPESLREVVQMEGEEATLGGTVFLDELETMPEQLQVRLLRYFEDRGSEALAPRIIAALKDKPEKLIEAGKLRADLYYRINVASITLPPLRERDKDVFFLLEYFIREAASRHNLKLPGLTKETLAGYRSHSWPGNVRELRNIAEKLVIGLPVSLVSTTAPAPWQNVGLDAAMEQFEVELLRRALLETGGRKGQAADLLGIPRKRLYLKMKQLGLD